MKNSDFDYSYYYANWHNDTPESKEQDMEQSRRLFDAHAVYPNKKTDKILEIGCGMGRLLLMLRQAGYENLVGIDIDKSQVKIARQENLKVFLADAAEFLRQDQTKYAAVYLFDVLEHIAKENQLELLALINERLAENGFIVIQSPNAMCPTMEYFRYNDFTHTISFTDITLGFLLHNAGFHSFTIRPQHQENEEVQKLKLPWVRLYRTEYRLENFILTPNLIGVAFKNQTALDKYLAQAPVIKNDYPEPKPKTKKKKSPLTSLLRRFFRP